jgi:dihydroorotate dehydrogenase
MPTIPEDLPRYDPSRTYAWNYDHAPTQVPRVDVPPMAGAWSLCGHRVASPLGVPAGPLLNGAWVLYYAALGFDVLTYKTVRSGPRACYPLPNLQPVDCGPLDGSQPELPASAAMRGSWAVSFGMPSAAPDVWRRDVQWTRDQLPSDKVLSVSVVGTVQEGSSIEQLVEDYAQCAAWAVESGADMIEANVSCPNVSTCDGQLYQDRCGLALLTQVVRERIGSVPFIIKVGQVADDSQAETLLDAAGEFVDAVAMTNSIATTVRQGDVLLFDGQRRGICGDATRSASLQQIRRFRQLADSRGLSLDLIGVGGISTAQHVSDYLAAGANAVQLATSAMVDPAVGLKIRHALSADTPQTAQGR